MIDERFTTPWPHYCDPPYTAELKRMLPGVRFTCDDCGRVYVLRKLWRTSLPYWDPETKQERRHRLGLKWRQRERR